MLDELFHIRHAMGYDAGTDWDTEVASLPRVLQSQFNSSW